MCSWCWGFAPEIETLSAELPVEVVVGGLRPGPMAQPLTPRMADALRHHWTEIKERTGQPFDMSGLDRGPDWVYDTEPAARAVTQMREMNEPETLDYFNRVQRAFYAESVDVTDLAVLTELARYHDVDLDVFKEELRSEESTKRAWADFTRARNWGISGFPTLVGELTDGRLALLARGWTPAATIQERIKSVA